MNRETGMSDAPDYDCDFYGDDFIRNPQPHYAAMRKLGAVVYLPRLGNHAVVRYSAVREALRNAGVYRSGEGVAGDDVGCRFLRGNTLASDPPLHDQLRRAMEEPLLPQALEQHRAWIEAAAEELIDEMQALLAAMVPRVRRLHVGQPSITLNNTIRSYSRLPVTLEAELP